MKTTVVYMAVQVVKRAPNGALIEFYDQGMRASFQEANQHAKKLSKEFPGVPYVVLERTLKEMTKEMVTES